MGPDSGIYKVVLVLHLMTAIVGFGGVMVAGYFGAMAAARKGSDGAAIGEVVEKGYKFAEWFMYAVPVLGILLVLISEDVFKFSQAWISLSFLLYIAAIGAVPRRPPAYRPPDQRHPQGDARAGPRRPPPSSTAGGKKAGMVGGMLNLMMVASSSSWSSSPASRERCAPSTRSPLMHPFERLRMAARAGAEDPGLVARQAASALAAIAGEPAALVTACRRLVDRQPTCGPVWWLAARMLAAADPANEAWRAADDLRHDPTVRALADALPDGAIVTVLGSPRQVGPGAGPAGRHPGPWWSTSGASPAASSTSWTRQAATWPRCPSPGWGRRWWPATWCCSRPTPWAPTGWWRSPGRGPRPPSPTTPRVPVWVVAGVGRVLPGGLWDGAGGPPGRATRALGPAGRGRAPRSGRRDRGARRPRVRSRRRWPGLAA